MVLVWSGGSSRPLGSVLELQQNAGAVGDDIIQGEKARNFL